MKAPQSDGLAREDPRSKIAENSVVGTAKRDGKSMWNIKILGKIGRELHTPLRCNTTITVAGTDYLLVYPLYIHTSMHSQGLLYS